MPADPQRQMLYDQLRERFINDPAFRAELRANPMTTLETTLGELTAEEREWVDRVVASDVSEDDLVDQFRRGLQMW